VIVIAEGGLPQFVFVGLCMMMMLPLDQGNSFVLPLPSFFLSSLSLSYRFKRKRGPKQLSAGRVDLFRMNMYATKRTFSPERGVLVLLSP